MSEYSHFAREAGAVRVAVLGMLALSLGVPGCSKKEEAPPAVAAQPMQAPPVPGAASSYPIPRDLPGARGGFDGAGAGAGFPGAGAGMPGAGAGMPGAGAGAGMPGGGFPGAGAGFPGAGAGMPDAGAGMPGVPSGAGAPAGVGAPPMPDLPGPLSDKNWILERQKEEIAASDMDKDGLLSEEEYLKRYVERHKKRFEMLDLNRDGKLTAEEMADMMDPQKMMERAQQMSAPRTPAPAPAPVPAPSAPPVVPKTE